MNVLFISPEYLLPLNSGGRLRTYHLLKSFSRYHTVSMAYFSKQPLHRGGELEEVCQDILHFRLPKPRSKLSARDKLLLGFKSLLKRSFPDVDFLMSSVDEQKLHSFIATNKIELVIIEFSYLLPIAELIKSFHPGVKIVLDAHNIEHRLQRRLGNASSNPIITWQKRLLWPNLREIERRGDVVLDALLAVSEEDVVGWQKLCPHVEVILVPNGVDIAYFSPIDKPAEEAVSFCGLMSYRPNEEGAVWFVDEVLPYIRQQLPELKFYIIGKDPSNRLKRIGAKDHITVTGTVDDVRPWVQRSKVVMVPLLSGGGTRLKIVEAMAMGKPIVSTHLGAEGIVDVEGIVRVDTPKEFASAVVELMRSDSLRELGEMNRYMAVEKYSWSHIGRELVKRLDGIG